MKQEEIDALELRFGKNGTDFSLIEVAGEGDDGEPLHVAFRKPRQIEYEICFDGLREKGVSKAQTYRQIAMSCVIKEVCSSERLEKLFEKFPGLASDCGALVYSMGEAPSAIVVKKESPSPEA